MASTVNKVQLLGNVGQTPECRTSASGVLVAQFSLATQKKTKDEMTPVWHTCVAFGKLAEIVQKYVVKGSKIYCEGAIDYQEVDGDSKRNHFTKILLNDLTLLSHPDSRSGTEKEDRLSLQAHNDLPF